MNNTSGLEPLGRAVLVEMLELKRKAGSLIELPESVESQSAAAQKRARVVAIGRCAWQDEPVPRCEVEDEVFITAFAGFVTKGPADGKTYRLVNDRDIFCKITKREGVKNG